MLRTFPVSHDGIVKCLDVGPLPPPRRMILKCKTAISCEIYVAALWPQHANLLPA